MAKNRRLKATKAKAKRRSRNAGLRRPVKKASADQLNSRIFQELDKFRARILKVAHMPATYEGQLAQVQRVTEEDPGNSVQRPEPRADVKTTIDGVDPTDTWFGPGQPIWPVAQTVAGRRFAFQVGTNYNYMPRAGEGADFKTLREFADSSYLVRIAISHVKDMVTSTPWEIVPDRKPLDGDLEGQKRRIEALTESFQYPDRERDFPTWLGMIYEDLKVLDAPALMATPSAYANTLTPDELLAARMDPNVAPDLVYAFEQIDGASIKVLADRLGRRPVFPDPAYYQVLYGMNAALLTTFDLHYMPKEPRSHKFYGFPDVEQIILLVTAAIRRDYSLLSYYTKGAIPEGLLTAPAGWKPQLMIQFMKNFNSMLQGNPEKWHQMHMIPGSYIPTKDAVLKDGTDEWFARCIALKIGMDPHALLTVVNKSTGETSKATSKEVGHASDLTFLERYLTVPIKNYLGQQDLRIRFQRGSKFSTLEEAQADRQSVASAGKSLDEMREDNGRAPYGVGAFFETTGGLLVPVGVLKKAEAEGKIIGPMGFIDPDAPPAPRLPPFQQEELLRVERAAKAKGKKVIRPLRFQGAQKAEDELTHKLIDFLASKKGAVIAEVLTHYEKTSATVQRADEPIKLTDDQVASLTDQVMNDLGIKGWVEVKDDIESAIKNVGMRAGASALMQVGADAEAGILAVNERAVAYAQARAAELVTDITEATRDMLRGDITKAFTEGLTRDQLATEFQGAYAFSEQRARTISQTEMNLAATDGTMAGWDESGVVESKGSLLSADHPKPDECDLNAKQKPIPVDALFISGHRGPPYHPGCFCVIYGVVSKELELFEEAA